MAEERINDLDKNKKYRIRKNDEGEEELYFVGEEDEVEEEYAEFEVPEFAYDNEDMTTMTSEQFYAAIEEAKKAEEKRAQKVIELKKIVSEALLEGDIVRAESAAEEGIVTDEKEGYFYCVKLRALSSDFTDLSLLKDCADIADGVKEYALQEQKEELFALSRGKLDCELQKKREEVEKLYAENEEKKVMRRKKFAPKRKRALISFICAVVPFMVFLVLTIIFGSQMYARKDGLNITLTIAFGCVTGVFAIISVICARFLVSATKMLAANKEDFSTKLGRTLIKERANLQLLERIYASITPQNN